MVSRISWIGLIIAILTLGLFVMNGCGEKKSAGTVPGDNATKESKATAATGTPDFGLSTYPRATVNPAFPPVNAPHLKNIHVLTSDPFDKVVEWYSQKLGKFDIDTQKDGAQAMWSKETDDGFFMTVTISTLTAPAGQVEVTINKMKAKQ
jgi:hypothetical protein